jgi:hypothetical protein
MRLRPWIILSAVVAALVGCDGSLDSDATGPSIRCAQKRASLAQDPPGVGSSATAVRCGDVIGPTVPGVPE